MRSILQACVQLLYCAPRCWRAAAVATLTRTINRHESEIAKLKSKIARFSRDVENIVAPEEALLCGLRVYCNSTVSM